MYCSKCGWLNRDEAEFCQKCGSAIEVLDQACGLQLGATRDLTGRDSGVKRRSSLDWFVAHLNWSLVLGIGTGLMLGYGLLFAGISVMKEDDLSVGSALALVVFSTILVHIVVILAGVWHLRQKGRSLWWLLLEPTAVIGWIVWLNLENKNSERATL